MNTLAEIEAAIVVLPAKEVARLENFLRDLRARSAPRSDIAEIARRNGFDPYPRRAGAPATNELVQRIREEEGI